MSRPDRPDTADKTRDRRLRTVAGHAIYFDWDDFLWDPHDWHESIALALARESGLDGLDDIQWRVIRFMRDFYFSQGRAPMNKDLKKGTGLRLMELEALFPQGIRNGARRLAGLPNPKACV
jgi:tRNA 2-thiouridine synthesizing protein E